MIYHPFNFKQMFSPFMSLWTRKYEDGEAELILKRMNVQNLQSFDQVKLVEAKIAGPGSGRMESNVDEYIEIESYFYDPCGYNLVFQRKWLRLV